MKGREWERDRTRERDVIVNRESEIEAMECMRDVLINHSLDVGDMNLFDRMTGSEWKQELVAETVGVKDVEVGSCVSEKTIVAEESWELQLLNTFLGEVSYYYKDDVIYAEDWSR